MDPKRYRMIMVTRVADVNMNLGRNLGQKCVKSSVKSSFCNYHLGARHLRTAVSPWATRLLIGIIRKSSAITGDKMITIGNLRS